ncbi:unnamed protein product [Orchesella dallaii]|uniref:Odorant receptor n=1 Tax=Orchesella dallaii TaxID=48710 RepID=A0ABP1RIZ6_9HEXA
MLSKNIMRIATLRIRLMALLGQSIFTWDVKTQKVVPSSVYKRFSWAYTMSGGFVFAAIHSLRIYQVLTDTEDEDGFDVRKFATLVIEGGEVIITIVISLLVILILDRRDTIIYTYNQIFLYNDVLLDMMTSRNLVQDAAQRRFTRKAEIISFVVCFLTAVFPFLLLVVVLHPLEPNNVLLREWFELELKPENIHFGHIVLVPLFLLAVYGAGNAIFIFGFLACAYCFIAIPFLNGISPVSIQSMKGSRRCTLNTRKHGVLEDMEIVNMYRTQQHLNILVNKVFASALLSLHHVACLAAAVSLAYFGIRFQSMLDDAGVLGYTVVFGGMSLPLIIQFLESYLLGQLVDISQNFRETGVKLMPRKMILGTFAKSCQKLYVEEAYPFFKVRRETFFEFCEQAVDHTINLLLW